MKLLIAIPTYRGKDYCWLRFLSNLYQLDMGAHEVDILVVDNSTDTDYVQYIRSFGLNAIRVPPQPRIQHTLADSHNALRKHTLQKGYDAMVHVESDQFPHRTALLELMDMYSDDTPVCTGLYFLSQGHEHHLCLFKNGMIAGDSYKMEVDRQYMGFHVTGRPEQVYAAGLGFALIGRKVLEKIKFRYVVGENYHPDMYFYEDCYLQQIPVWCDTRMLIVHENQDWQTNFQFLKYLAPVV